MAGQTSDEDAYDRLLRKVRENRDQCGKDEAQSGPSHGENQMDKSYDGVQVTVNESDDDFTDSDMDSVDDESSQDSDVYTDSDATSNVRQLSRQEKLEQWRSDPDFQFLVSEVLMGFQKDSGSNEATGAKKASHKTREGKQIMQTAPIAENPDMVNKTRNVTVNSPQLVACKSPSDTIIYKPAFKKTVGNTDDVIARFQTL